MVWCGLYLGCVSLLPFDFNFDGTLMLRRGMGVTLMAEGFQGGSEDFELLVLSLALFELCCEFCRDAVSLEG